MGFAVRWRMMPNSALTRSSSISAQGSDPRPPASATAIASSDAPGPAIGASTIGRSMPVRSWKRRSICMGSLLDSATHSVLSSRRVLRVFFDPHF